MRSLHRTKFLLSILFLFVIGQNAIGSRLVTQVKPDEEGKLTRESKIEQVEKWGLFENQIRYKNQYANKFEDVELKVKYIRPDKTTVEFFGFYDGDDSYRFRFMPDQIGVWEYEATFSDGENGPKGKFECIPSDIPGLVSKDKINPIWFGYSRGAHELIRSLHVGDCFFSNEPNSVDGREWNPKMREQFLDWAQEQGYNMLSVASHYLNRRSEGRGEGWKTPDLWDDENNVPRPEEYDKMEEILNDLADRKMLVYPFAGFFGRESNFPVEWKKREAYIKYTLARLAPYWNLLFVVAGPEPLLKGNPFLEKKEILQLGAIIDSLDVFGHLLSVHNQTGDDQFKDAEWASYTILQGPKKLDRKELSDGLLANYNSKKPIYAQETLWSYNKYHPEYSDDDIRKNAIMLNMTAASINFADNQGNSSSGFSGYPDLILRVQKLHDILKAVWDFFETIPFYTMSPAQDIVDNGYCLANIGKEYLVYLEKEGSVNIDLPKGTYQAVWINAQNTDERKESGAINNGSGLHSPSDGDDWFLHIKSGK